MTSTISDLARLAGGQGPGAVRAAARLMSILSDSPQWLPELFQAVHQQPDARDRLSLPRLLLGITGAPGCGKSTLTDALVRQMRAKAPERRIGVIAVDPSSPFTGGAILGDRVRMMRHATDPNVFVRSLASRGHLGGLALGVKGVIRVMGLLGCDTVVVETVGVGQSEVEIAGVADVVLVVLAPGQGDGIQLLKAGLMEIGDVFVVNKADKPDAGRLHGDLLAMLQGARDEAAGHHAESFDGEGGDQLGPWMSRRPGTLVEPRTCLVSGEYGQGVPELAADLDGMAAEFGDRWREARLGAIEQEVREAVVEEASRRLRDTLDRGDTAIAARVLSGQTSVADGASELLSATAAASTLTPQGRPE